MIRQEKVGLLGEKTAPFWVCTLQIPHGSAWDWTQAYSLPGRRLTARAVEHNIFAVGVQQETQGGRRSVAFAYRKNSWYMPWISEAYQHLDRYRPNRTAKTDSCNQPQLKSRYVKNEHKKREGLLHIHLQTTRRLFIYRPSAFGSFPNNSQPLRMKALHLNSV
jgi:hypothetical protein